jgi:hypothetical protein
MGRPDAQLLNGTQRMHRICIALLTAGLLLTVACGDDGESEAGPGVEIETPVGDDGDTGDDGDPPPPEDTPAGADRSGRLDTDAGVYEFDATTCVIYEDEFEINGPGTAPDGTPVYVDFSAGDGYGYLRIDVGVSEQFESSDDIINGDDFEYTLSGSSLSGTASLSDGNMQPLGEATVEVDCG